MSIATAHFILFVRDQPASRRFYETVLGVAATLDVPGMTELPLGAGAVLGLMPEAGARRQLGDAVGVGPPARSELYLVVDDPAAHHARALDAGATELSPLLARDWGHDAAYSRDPDGHVIAFAAPSRTQGVQVMSNPGLV
jgi:catechol 2,3-dioxygenase-like lactoylglutathione lyase family enzyme